MISLFYLYMISIETMGQAASAKTLNKTSKMKEELAVESKRMLRISDFTSEPKRMLPPIKGYEKESLVTLEQAVKSLHSLVPDIEEMVWTVKQNCQHPQHPLSSDESASIMLYTLEWMPRESSFYFILNQSSSFTKSTRIITLVSLSSSLYLCSFETSINKTSNCLSWN